MKITPIAPLVASLLSVALAVMTTSANAQAVSFKVPDKPLTEDPYTFYLLNFDDDKETVQGKPFAPFHGSVKWVPGKFGKAAEFNGSQLLLVPAYSSQEIPKPDKILQTTGTENYGQSATTEEYGNSLGLRLKDGQFTVECWIKIAPGNFNKKREQTILAFGQSLSLKVSPKGTIAFYVPLNWKGHTNAVTGRKNIVDGKWHHVAAIVENKDSTEHQMRLYIDGQRDEGEKKVEAEANTGFQVTAQNMPLSDNFFTVGAWRPHEETFTGTLDDLRISFKVRYP